MDSQAEQIRELSKNSLSFLCREILGYKDWDKVHDDLELFLARPSNRKAILLPRGHLKSTIVTVGRSIQKILQNPNVRILLANQVWDNSRNFLAEIKELLESKSVLPQLFGEFVSDKWNQDSVVIKQRYKALKDPTVMTTGAEAERTGGHYDLIILDDLTGLTNSQSPEQREKTKRFRRSMFNLLEPDGEIIEIGTRWHFDDTFADILDPEKDGSYYDVMVRQVVENGKLIFPLKFSKKYDIKRKCFVPTPKSNDMDFVGYLKETLTPSEFNSQYMNNPIDDENAIFRKSYFKYWEKLPNALFKVMTVDPAISLKQEADYSAIVICGMDKDGNIYVMDVSRGHWTPSELINNIFVKHDQWKPSIVGLEAQGFQQTLHYDIEAQMKLRGKYFCVEPVKQNSKIGKELRIKALEPAWRGGKVYHAKWMKALEDELLTFPKGRNDDMIDALSMQLNFLVPGSEYKVEHVPEGSWEQIFRQARQIHAKDFFKD